MKKSIEYLATWLAVYFVTAILATGTMLFVITTNFNSYYEGKINGNFIGYYESPEQIKSSPRFPCSHFYGFLPLQFW